MTSLQLTLWLNCCFSLIFCLPAAAQNIARTTLSLDGQWDVQDSVQADQIPKQFRHSAPVPGLTHSATPAFVDVDQYQSRELLSNLLKQGLYTRAEYDKLGDARGISHQQRNYFWYRKYFNGPSRRAVAILRSTRPSLVQWST
jgi:hypothetical protein